VAKLTIVLARHSIANNAPVNKDRQLTPEGETLAKATGRNLATEYPSQLIVTSGVRRTQQTAACFAESQPGITVVDNLGLFIPDDQALVAAIMTSCLTPEGRLAAWRNNPAIVKMASDMSQIVMSEMARVAAERVICVGHDPLQQLTAAALMENVQALNLRLAPCDAIVINYDTEAFPFAWKICPAATVV
jgi:phosphohistidine phosphatase SixA